MRYWRNVVWQNCFKSLFENIKSLFVCLIRSCSSCPVVVNSQMAAVCIKRLVKRPTYAWVRGAVAYPIRFITDVQLYLRAVDSPWCLARRIDARARRRFVIDDPEDVLRMPICLSIRFHLAVYRILGDFLLPWVRDHFGTRIGCEAFVKRYAYGMAGSVCF